MNVLVSDAISQQGVDILLKAGLSVDVKTKLTPAQLIEEIYRSGPVFPMVQNLR